MEAIPDSGARGRSPSEPSTLVARFVEQHSWPDSRKTAWLMGLSLPTVLVGLHTPVETYLVDALV